MLRHAFLQKPNFPHSSSVFRFTIFYYEKFPFVRSESPSALLVFIVYANISIIFIAHILCKSLSMEKWKKTRGDKKKNIRNGRHNGCSLYEMVQRNTEPPLFRPFYSSLFHPVWSRQLFIFLAFYLRRLLRLSPPSWSMRYTLTHTYKCIYG